MEEMRFKSTEEYSDEYISMETMCDFYNKTKDEILLLGYAKGNSGIIKIKGFEYEVVLPHGNNKEVREDGTIPNKKPKKSYYIKVEHKKTGGGNRRLYITDVIKNKAGTTHKRKYYMDGKLTTVELIAKELEITSKYLEQKLARVKKATINKHEIRIKNHLTRYMPVKDGVEHKRMSIKDCATLTGITGKTVAELYKKGTYSAKDGWKFI